MTPLSSNATRVLQHFADQNAVEGGFIPRAAPPSAMGGLSKKDAVVQGREFLHDQLV
jgi:hypothetical protein